MAADANCPDCGAPIPEGQPKGLCPRCALSGLLKPDEEGLPNQTVSIASDTLTPALSHPMGEGARRAGEGRAGTRFGDYELLEEIARGGMGIVFKARQRKLDRIVAVKMILAGGFASREQALRFRVEAEAAARLQHPNIVRIHETGEQDGQPYFSMDYVEGGNLTRLVREKPLPAKCAASYVKTIAEAIHYAHEQGILHRDLKPSNVLIDRADQPRVTDFGLAKRMTKESFLTVTGDVMGSPSFMPPEQAGAKTKAGRHTDVYGLGAILFYLVTGRPPFVAENVAETLHHVLNSEPMSPRLLNPSVPQDIATICLKCLEKEPGKRFQTAQQLADELGRFLNDEPILARPVNRAEKAWRWCRRKPAVASALVGLCLVFAIAFVSITLQWRRAESALALVKTILEQSESDEDPAPVILSYNGVSHARGFSRDRRKEFRLYPDGSAFLTVSPLPLPFPVTFPFTPNDPYFTQTAGRSTNNNIRTIRLWGAAQATTAQSLVVTQAMASFSPSGEFLAIVLPGQGVRVWDATTGKPLTSLFQGDDSHDDDMISVGFTPDSNYLVTRTADGVIGVWSTRTGEHGGTFRFQAPRY